MAQYPFRLKYNPVWLDEVLASETDVAWLYDPAHFDYVRQGAIVTRKPSGLPSDYIGGSSLIVGYSNVCDNGRGLYRRRIFYVRDTDRYCDPMGGYRYGAPVEAMDPITISAGEAGFITDRV